MKVYISADIEGITGLVSWSQCSRPDGNSYDYAFARRMMSHDVNAAIRGARAAGATEVVVKDSHGNSKNLLIEDLEPGTQLISGHGGGANEGRIDGMMQGIDSSFGCAMLVGYHAMAGTPAGIMEHTLTGGIHRVWINARESGEIGLSAGTAGRHGVPLVMISSDDKGCAEAADLVPGLETVAVKEGMGRYMGRLLHPSETAPLIEAAAKRAVERAAQIDVFRWEEPTHLRIEFNRAEEAEAGASLLFAPSRVNGYTLESEFASYADAHRAVWNLMSMSFQGIGSQH